MRAGNPIRTGGTRVFPVYCPRCGFKTSTAVDLFPPQTPVLMLLEGVEEEVREFPPVAVDSVEVPPDIRDSDALVLRLGEGFDPADILVGDVVLFQDGGVERCLTVVSLAAKSVLGDCAGAPDMRVKRKRLTGKVVSL